MFKRLLIMSLLLVATSAFSLKRIPEWDELDFRRARDEQIELTEKDLEEVLDLIETQIECNDELLDAIEKQIKDNEDKPDESGN